MGAIFGAGIAEIAGIIRDTGSLRVFSQCRHPA